MKNKHIKASLYSNLRENKNIHTENQLSNLFSWAEGKPYKKKEIEEFLGLLNSELSARAFIPMILPLALVAFFLNGSYIFFTIVLFLPISIYIYQKERKQFKVEILALRERIKQYKTNILRQYLGFKKVDTMNAFYDILEKDYASEKTPSIADLKKQIKFENNMVGLPRNGVVGKNTLTVKESEKCH